MKNKKVWCYFKIGLSVEAKFGSFVYENCIKEGGLIGSEKWEVKSVYARA